MKVLQVNCVYGKGSTGKITRDIHRELLARGIESVVCYGRGEKVREPGVYKTCGEWYSKCNNLFSRFTGLMYGGCFFSTNKLIRVICREKPDVVHLQCINGYFVNIYRLLTWLKKQKIKTVLTLHAEFMYTANCGHALDCDRWLYSCGNCPRLRQETKSWFLDGTARSYRKMQKAFSGFDENLTVVSVSPWLKERAEQSPILKGKSHCVIFNGVDTDVFHPYNAEALRRKHGLTKEKILFHATPYFSDDKEHLKGGYYILRLAELLQDQNVKVIVAGDYREGMRVPENVILLGRIRNQQELARYYSMADITVLTSKKETFCMVVAESLCCGTPVVGFRSGGPEKIALTEFSSFVAYGDMNALFSSVSGMLQREEPTERTGHGATTVYAKATMADRYVEQYMM